MGRRYRRRSHASQIISDSAFIGSRLALEVYKVTSTFPKEEIFGIISQLRRATSSIPTNISEGCGRNSDKEFNQFLNIALGSALETEYLFILSKDLNYINLEKFQDFDFQINTIKSKIYKLKQKLTKLKAYCLKPKTIKKMAKDKAVSKNTIVFNNLVANIAEFNENWEVPASESWHSRFLK